MEFRSDINGLRAVAVVAVVLYHFGVPWFGGGFIGVDVFFVISGFLMTGIILTGMIGNRFSIISFYKSRADRIVPALLFLCITLLTIGWFWLSPVDYAQLGKHAASAISFVSNFVFKSEDGYFDTSSQDKWLLHTWSLSVEWQFYLIYPLIVVFVCRWRMPDGALPLRRLGKVLIILALTSLGLSIALTPRQETFSFYLLPTRLWELLTGALVYIGSTRRALSERAAAIAYSLGLSMIAAAILGFDFATEWPGYAALLPVLGTALLIWGNYKNDRLMSNCMFQRIGAWSYSIYLWHWPAHVALRDTQLHEDKVWLALAMLCSILIGALSYRFVETPLRRSKTLFGSNDRLRVATALGILLCVAFGGGLIYRQDGIPQRVSVNIRNVENVILESRKLNPSACALIDTPTTSTGCLNQQPRFVVWGDSHAWATFGAVQQASGALFGSLNANRCPPLLGGYLDNKKRKNSCVQITADTLRAVGQLPTEVPLVVIFRFSFYVHGYTDRQKKPVKLRYVDISDSDVEKDPEKIFTERLVTTVCSAGSPNRPVFVVLPIPEMGVEVPHTLSRQLMIYGQAQDITVPLTEYQKRHRTVHQALQKARERCGIKLLDPVSYLCKAGRCQGSVNQKPLYFDDDHLSEQGALRLVPMFREVFRHTNLDSSKTSSPSQQGDRQSP